MRPTGSAAVAREDWVYAEERERQKAQCSCKEGDSEEVVGYLYFHGAFEGALLLSNYAGSSY